MDASFEWLGTLYHDAFFVYISLILIGGIGATYFGWRLHLIEIWIVGFFLGTIIGTVASGAELIGIICGLVSGFVLVWLYTFSIFVVGAVVAGVVCHGVMDPSEYRVWVSAAVAFIGGGLFVVVNQFIVVVATSFCGAVMIVYAAANLVH